MKNKVGDMQVWWVPQMPMKAFNVPVKDVEESGEDDPIAFVEELREKSARAQPTPP